MPFDAHPGREKPVFAINGRPQEVIQALTVHGLLVSVQTGRPCPCGEDPNCTLCGGLGRLYGFQREFLAADEDARYVGDGTVEVFRRPLTRPVSVERVISPQQGGLRRYGIVDYDDGSITIDGADMPRHWQKLRVTHYYDRYERVLGERPDVNEEARTVSAVGTRHDGRYEDGNTFEAHADIAEVLSVRHEDGREYRVRGRSVNVLHLDGTGPPLEKGRVILDYLRVPLTKSSINDISDIHQTDGWSHDLESGDLTFQLEPWYEVADGDVIVIRSQERRADTVMPAAPIMHLPEFEITDADDVIDEDGNSYGLGNDFIILGRQLRWTGDRPDSGKRCSIRFGYRPAYVAHRGPIAPNTSERRRFQISVTCRAWRMGSRRPKEFISSAI
jgi:hypothetical protein